MGGRGSLVVLVVAAAVVAAAVETLMKHYLFLLGISYRLWVVHVLQILVQWHGELHQQQHALLSFHVGVGCALSRVLLATTGRTSVTCPE